MGKKIAWTALMAIVSTAAAGLGARLAARMWTKFAHEPPPPMPKWSRFLIGKPLRKVVQGSVGAPPPM
jgi:hypothetical protein